MPLVCFAGLVAILAIGFHMGRHDIHPSALIDQPFPSFESTNLLTGESITEEFLVGKTHLVNIWASWCDACHVEHPILNEIAQQGDVEVIGLNYKDETDDAREFLNELGNPYQAIIVDPSGDLGIDLGVYGAPETFLVDREGKIQFKHVGPVTMEIWEEKIQPLIAGGN